MLSIANVNGGQDAARYYEKADDYYTKDRSPSEWQGKAAETLGLKGEVKLEDFQNLLEGNLPNGEQIQVAALGHRGGSDLTFSAPKSFSMQALIAGDLTLIDAHDRAVKLALKYAEGLVAYRQMREGEKERVLSKNMAVATFRHELSRACDPQLHTHCVVLNLTQREDGKWRAMDNELFYRQKMLMGALYRAELAREIQKLGYEVRLTHLDGRFELAHITEKQIELFSQRSQAIEEALKKEGKTRKEASPQEKQIITIATRPKKTDVDREILRKYWQEKSQDAQIEYSTHLKLKSDLPTKFGTAESLHFALEHLLERQSVFTEAQLLRESLQHGVGKTTLKEIQLEIKKRITNGTVIQAGERLTTPEAIKTEKNLLCFEKKGRRLNNPILSIKQHSLLEKISLNKDQRFAAQLILSSPNQIVGIQGLAGTGKTFMLQSARKLAEQEGYEMIGLTPSASASEELAKTGIQSQTIASFQHSKEHQLSSKSILVVDEAGMVSSKQMEFILKSAEKFHSRVVLIGDTQQLKAVEAGKPFAQLQANGMETAGMSEIQRQKNVNLKEAVKLAATGKVEASLSLLEKSTIEIKNSEERQSSIAKEYVLLSEDERKKTLVVSGTHEARRSINQKIRDNLHFTVCRNIPTLEEKNFTKAQLRELSTYKVGDLIQAERNYQSMGLHKGDLAQVKEIKQSYIVLKKSDGSITKWEPQKKNKVSVYEQTHKEIAAGEIIRFTRNDPQKQFHNGDRGKVITIDENQNIYLQKENGKMFKLDGRKPLHLEYGYCSTVHAAQGKTCDRVLIEADTKSLTSAQDNYYVAISRARHEVKIYTNDKDKLPDAMSRVNDKQSALEIYHKTSEKSKNVEKTMEYT